MQTKKFKNMSRGIYISLAICILTIAGVGIFASVRSISKIMFEAKEDVESISVNTEFVERMNALSKVEEKDVFSEDEPVTKIEETKAEPTVWTVPVGDGSVLKRFSGDELVYSETMNDYRTHKGLDVTASTGDAVICVGDGIISSIVEDPLWGTTVSVEHANGIVSVYKNLDKTLPEGIEEGAFVEQGGIIGAVSASALVEIGELPHLHLEVYQNGEALDPIEVLKIYE